MITIIQDISNTFYVTLAERQTSTGGYYLVRFLNEENYTDTTVISTVADSGYAYRITGLRITAAGSGTVSTAQRQSGTVALITPGFYSYEIYWQSGSTNLYHTSGTTFLERGKAIVMRNDGGEPDFQSPTEYTGGTAENQTYSG